MPTDPTDNGGWRTSAHFRTSGVCAHYVLQRRPQPNGKAVTREMYMASPQQHGAAVAIKSSYVVCRFVAFICSRDFARVPQTLRAGVCVARGGPLKNVQLCNNFKVCAILNDYYK